MPKTQDRPTVGANLFVGKPPITVMRDGQRVQLTERNAVVTAEETGASWSPYKHQVLLAQRVLVTAPLPPVRRESVTPPPRESVEHQKLRHAEEFLVERLGTQGSIERGDVRRALQAGADRVRPVTRTRRNDGVVLETEGSLAVAIPAEVLTLYGLVSAALTQCEAEEATQ